ncbi:MAG: hypothetical protein J6A01_08850 [Proteobacteria bacterium]|nr:hypothetical protein [Pseudomonadota bacterium]
MDYTPENYNNPKDNNAYEQMCYNSMTYDRKYDRADGCYLKEVDRYVEQAIACCEPLKSDIEYKEFEQFEIELTPLNANFSKIVLSSSPGCDSELGCFHIAMPANAYTYCLFNTHPRTYKCDIEEAKQFDIALNECCMNAADNDECVRSFILNDAVCVKACCEGLPDQENDQYISKENCYKVLKESNECIETPVDACCRIAPKEPSRGHIDRDICKQIYTDSHGQCINTDEKYEIYKNQ